MPPKKDTNKKTVSNQPNAGKNSRKAGNNSSKNNDGDQRRELHEAKIPDSVVHYRRRCNCNT